MKIPTLLLAIFAPFAVASARAQSAATTFTPLHTYFMAASGCSDVYLGTSAAAPWCTPNHAAIVCGDVIVAAAGTYNSKNLQVTRTPGVCPSTSGGVDGSGGIYAAIILCGGGVGTCMATDTSTQRSFNISASYWSVQGWKISNSGDGVAFAQDCSKENLFHHLSFINDIAFNTGAGFSFGMCGGTGSFDYVAVVGSAAQNANTSSFCTSAFNFVVPKNLDTTAGTHIFASTNYGIANAGNARCGSDGNGMIVDSPDINSYSAQIVFRNNIIFSSRQYGIHIFSQERSNATPTIKVYNNTVYNSGVNPVGTTIGEITQFNQKFAQITQNNIALTGAASRNRARLYSFLVSGVNPNAIPGGPGTQNIFKGSAAVCNSGTGCDPDNHVVAFNGGSYGTNTYSDPSFNNTTDLLDNLTSIPDCRSFENVTQCMGYDASTERLTNPSVIYDLTPTAAGASGKGYQKPTLSCASSSSDPDFPTWLKGLVYLHWTGSSVQQKTGLASVPCGL